ncbi:hypothetical protein [Pseudothauera lacus]|uniref:Uncharacterized protein n=1 Tax=Pseudothauera lacus TaxID=2136175 RepID=A0A2T4IF36_9RHOO|nr:hypothetical protein [Pseudothauera lacus]PTD96368.1 hypothetical protein C8261_08600 [Pseudothauera lacus]
MSDLPDKARRAGRLARQLLKTSLNAAASGAHELGRRKGAVQEAVADGVGEAARVAARALGDTACGLSAAARALDQNAHGRGEQGGGLGARVLQGSGTALGRAATGLAGAQTLAAPLGAAVGGAFGAVVGTVGASLDAAALSEADFAAQAARIAAQAQRYAELRGGRAVPPRVVDGGGTEWLRPAFVDWLNGGQLPAGHCARFAAGALVVEDGAGLPAAALQARAEESLAHLEAALARHDDIAPAPVAELAAELLLRAIAEQAREGTLDAAAVEAVLASASGVAAAPAGAPASTWLTGRAGLAFLALASFADRSRPLEARSEDFGARTAEILLSAGASRLALAGAHLWWVGLLAGAGSQLLWGQGRGKRARLEALAALADSAERVLRRMTP